MIWEEMQEVDKFNYVEMMIGTDGVMREKMDHWTLERRKVWGTICGIRRVDRVRNSLITERCGSELSVLERMEGNVLKWLRIWKE